MEKQTIKSMFNIMGLLLVTTCSFCQGPILKAGDPFPNVVIGEISNAPIKELRLKKPGGNKLYLLNFWGTWCSPCMPEMDNLARLQKANVGKIQVVAISDDPVERKQKYTSKKPSDIWLATDTTYLLYRMLGLASVGQCAIVGKNGDILAIVKSDSIDQKMIDRLLGGITVASNASVKEPATGTRDDPFGVDSLTAESRAIRGYMNGRQTMGKRYLSGPFDGRRLTWFNIGIPTLYRAAYDIGSQKQEIFDSSVSKKEIGNYEDKNTLYCVDLLVGPLQKDSLYVLLQTFLNANLPVKVRTDKRPMPVYLLKRKEGTTLGIGVSTAPKSSSSFSGNGFEGKGVRIKDLAGYLTNEMGLPVVDETGLTGLYDIRTSVDLRTVENVRSSVQALGLEMVRSERLMPVIIYFR